MPSKWCLLGPTHPDQTLGHFRLNASGHVTEQLHPLAAVASVSANVSYSKLFKDSVLADGACLVGKHLGEDDRMIEARRRTRIPVVNPVIQGGEACGFQDKSVSTIKRRHSSF